MNRKSLLALAGVALALAGAAPAGAAGAPQVTVQPVPGEVVVAPGSTADVLVVVRNGGAEPLADLELSWIAQEGVEVAAGSTKIPELKGYGEAARQIRVSLVPEGPAKGEVQLQLDYQWMREGGSPVPRVSVATLKVSPRPPDAVEPLASVEVKTSAKSLVEHRPGLVYVVVKNTSHKPLQVIDMKPIAPGFVSAELLESLSWPRELSPQEVLVVPYRVEAREVEGGEGGREAIRPGKHLLLFRVSLKGRRQARTVSETVVASHELEVGILGESEILTALGVPTFLVLPGFLMLVTFGLLWKYVPSRSGQPRGEYPFQKAGAELWVVAISLSILAAALYPLLTGLFGAPRSYLEGYGLRDVVWVWAGSILATVLVFLVGTAIRDRVASWRRRRVFDEEDAPLEVLRKLKRRKQNAFLPRARVKIGEEDRNAFVLQRKKERLWVAPGIRFQGLEKVDAEKKRKIVDQSTRSGDAGSLADLVEGTPEVKLEWDPAYGFAGLREIAEADVEGEIQPANRLVTEPDEFQ